MRSRSWVHIRSVRAISLGRDIAASLGAGLLLFYTVMALLLCVFANGLTVFGLAMKHLNRVVFPQSTYESH